MGIMRLAKTHSNELMENASREALDKKTCSFKYFSIILKQLTARAATDQTEKVITHENVRGSSAFIGGGINA